MDVLDQQWRGVAHEAGHIVCTYAAGGRIEVVRLSGASGCMDASWPEPMQPEQRCALKAMGRLAGLEAEFMLCGIFPKAETYASDLKAFENLIEVVWEKDQWPARTIQTVFGRLVRKTLQDNGDLLEVLVYFLKGKVYGPGVQLHLWGSDIAQMRTKAREAERSGAARMG